MTPLEQQLLVGVLIGLGAGYLGAFMILRRMSLVGDALSHVALPGIAIALLLNINPFIGAFVVLFGAIIGVWILEDKTHLPSETLVGIFFTVSLALGLLLTPEPELLEALFGNIAKINQTDILITALAVIVILVVMAKIYKRLMLGILSRDLANASNISYRRTNLLFLFLVSVIVALGLKVAGTMLMGSLVIIPAAAAKNLSINLKGFLFLAGFFGALSALFGIIGADYLGLQPGPIVVLASGIIFTLTLPFKK